MPSSSNVEVLSENSFHKSFNNELFNRSRHDKKKKKNELNIRIDEIQKRHLIKMNKNNKTISRPHHHHHHHHHHHQHHRHHRHYGEEEEEEEEDDDEESTNNISGGMRMDKSDHEKKNEVFNDQNNGDEDEDDNISDDDDDDNEEEEEEEENDDDDGECDENEEDSCHKKRTTANHKKNYEIRSNCYKTNENKKNLKSFERRQRSNRQKRLNENKLLLNNNRLTLSSLSATINTTSRHTTTTTCETGQTDERTPSFCRNFKTRISLWEQMNSRIEKESDRTSFHRPFTVSPSPKSTFTFSSISGCGSCCTDANSDRSEMFSSYAGTRRPLHYQASTTLRLSSNPYPRQNYGSTTCKLLNNLGKICTVCQRSSLHTSNTNNNSSSGVSSSNMNRRQYTKHTRRRPVSAVTSSLSDCLQSSKYYDANMKRQFGIGSSNCSSTSGLTHSIFSTPSQSSDNHLFTHFNEFNSTKEQDLTTRSLYKSYKTDKNRFHSTHLTNNNNNSLFHRNSFSRNNSLDWNTSKNYRSQLLSSDRYRVNSKNTNDFPLSYRSRSYMDRILSTRQRIEQSYSSAVRRFDDEKWKYYSPYERKKTSSPYIYNSKSKGNYKNSLNSSQSSLLQSYLSKQSTKYTNKMNTKEEKNEDVDEEEEEDDDDDENVDEDDDCEECDDDEIDIEKKVKLSNYLQRKRPNKRRKERRKDKKHFLRRYKLSSSNICSSLSTSLSSTTLSSSTDSLNSSLLNYSSSRQVKIEKKNSSAQKNDKVEWSYSPSSTSSHLHRASIALKRLVAATVNNPTERNNRNYSSKYLKDEKSMKGAKGKPSNFENSEDVEGKYNRRRRTILQNDSEKENDEYVRKLHNNIDKLNVNIMNEDENEILNEEKNCPIGDKGKLSELNVPSTKYLGDNKDLETNDVPLFLDDCTEDLRNSISFPSLSSNSSLSISTISNEVKKRSSIKNHIELTSLGEKKNIMVNCLSPNSNDHSTSFNSIFSRTTPIIDLDASTQNDGESFFSFASNNSSISNGEGMTVNVNRKNVNDGQTIPLIRPYSSSTIDNTPIDIYQSSNLKMTSINSVSMTTTISSSPTITTTNSEMKDEDVSSRNSQQLNSSSNNFAQKDNIADDEVDSPTCVSFTDSLKRNETEGDSTSIHGMTSQTLTNCFKKLKENENKEPINVKENFGIDSCHSIATIDTFSISSNDINAIYLSNDHEKKLYYNLSTYISTPNTSLDTTAITTTTISTTINSMTNLTISEHNLSIFSDLTTVSPAINCHSDQHHHSSTIQPSSSSSSSQEKKLNNHTDYEEEQYHENELQQMDKEDIAHSIYEKISYDDISNNNRSLTNGNIPSKYLFGEKEKKIKLFDPPSSNWNDVKQLSKIKSIQKNSNFIEIEPTTLLQTVSEKAPGNDLKKICTRCGGRRSLVNIGNKSLNNSTSKNPSRSIKSNNILNDNNRLDMFYFALDATSSSGTEDAMTVVCSCNLRHHQRKRRPSPPFYKFPDEIISDKLTINYPDNNNNNNNNNNNFQKDGKLSPTTTNCINSHSPEPIYNETTINFCNKTQSLSNDKLKLVKKSILKTNLSNDREVDRIGRNHPKLVHNLISFYEQKSQRIK
ncbi:hypothetical protein SNEBB_005460 [Seison nebaliae]|nr:hypothetical protein SNEBB_005460 [Seison nebaliae]